MNRIYKCFLIMLQGVSLFFPVAGQPADSLNRKQSFRIDSTKRIPDSELSEKKEGTYVTGLPRFEFDPIRGLGIGGNVNLYINKTKEDPFFDFTAYRHNINAEFFVFQNGRIRYAINYDAPYIFNSGWRLRADVVHWEDPNAQYWGVGRKTLDRLQFRDKKTGNTRTFSKVNDYETNLAIAEPGEDGRYYNDFHYHHFYQKEHLANVSVEKVMLGGKLRFMFGYEGLFTSFASHTGNKSEAAYLPDGTKTEAISRTTLADKEIADGTWDRFNLTGFNNNNGRYMFTSMLASALIYDTRDFEPDPSNGLFFQYSHEYSPPWLGSEFDFHKFMVQGQYIRTLKKWKEGKGRLTFAGMGAFGYTFGKRINFIEMWDLSSQAEAGGIMVLGGSRSLRGYRESRFLAPAVALVNLELRARFYSFRLLKQYFSLGATSFYDMGSVWDRPSQVNFSKWRGAPGAGLRITWNQSTIIRLDFARSREGGQLFFGLGHIF